MVHLVYCDDKTKELSRILDGSKTMIIRGAAGRKIPHSRVFKDEVLYFMEKGSKEITAKAIVTDVQNFIKLNDGEITTISESQKCNLFRTGCQLTLNYANSIIKAEIQNGDEKQILSAEVNHNEYGGIHIQHTGSTGASAIVISGLKCEYGK